MATFVVSVEDQIVEDRERKSVENRIRVLDKVTDVQPLFAECPEMKALSKLLIVRFNVAADNAAGISDANARLQAVKGVEKAAHAPKLDMPYGAPAA